MAGISETEREAYEFVRQAIADSYDGVALVNHGALSAEKNRLADREAYSKIVAGASMEVHSAWHGGDAVSFATEQDFALEQLAQQNGGYSEFHMLCKTPVTRERALQVVNGYERADMSDEAADRQRQAAWQERRRLRDQVLGQEAAPPEDFDTASYIERRNLEDEQREQAAREWRHSHGMVRR